MRWRVLIEQAHELFFLYWLAVFLGGLIAVAILYVTIGPPRRSPAPEGSPRHVRISSVPPSPPLMPLDFRPEY
jgi:hypothetical protein